MLQVASDLTIHAHSHTQPRHPRPTQVLNRAASPFESLLDDGASAVPTSAPPSADDKPSRAENSQPVRAADSGNESKTAPANENEAAAKCDAVRPDKPENDDQAASEDAAGLNAEIIEWAAGDDGIKPADNDKSVGGEKKIHDPTAAPAADNTQTIITTDAIAAVPAPESDQGEHFPQLPEQAAPAAQVATQSKPLDHELLKSVVGKQADVQKQSDAGKKVAAGEQTDTDQSTDEIVDDPNLAAKANLPAHANGKPQQATSDSDKQIVAQARGEGSTSNGHSGTDAPPVLPADATAPRGIPETSPPVVVSAQPHAAANAQPAAVPLDGLARPPPPCSSRNPARGRIDVRLDVDRNGNVTSRLIVERADTLDLLRRDAAGLERALQDAGLKTADNGLQFSLRDQSLNQQQAGGNADAGSAPAIDQRPKLHTRQDQAHRSTDDMTANSGIAPAQAGLP